jgi:carbon monoxide dehydrogenase subunit G
MSLVTASIQIDAPPEQVWETVMDPSFLSEWVTIHRRLVHADAGPAHEGYKMEQQMHLRGVNIDVCWELVECRPRQRAVWEGRGPARSHAHTEYVLAAAGAGTRFDYRNEFRPPLGPLGAILSRALVGGMPQREANRSLERLKARIERSSQTAD